MRFKTVIMIKAIIVVACAVAGVHAAGDKKVYKWSGKYYVQSEDYSWGYDNGKWVHISDDIYRKAKADHERNLPRKIIPDTTAWHDANHMKAMDGYYYELKDGAKFWIAISEETYNSVRDAAIAEEKKIHDANVYAQEQAEKKAAAQAKIDDKANEKYQKAYDKCIKKNIGNAHTQKAVIEVRKMCMHEASRKSDSIWPW